MEYADQGDLLQDIQQHIQHKQYFEEMEIWKMIYQVILALQTLHQMKILHRDLKSANVFLHRSNYKLGDMNVSKVAKKDLVYTQTGTPYYASPEVWRDQPYDTKSDIWSLGCVAYEMAALKQTSFQSIKYGRIIQKSLKRFIWKNTIQIQWRINDYYWIVFISTKQIQTFLQLITQQSYPILNKLNHHKLDLMYFYKLLNYLKIQNN
ncbi:unnamed protein product [Paramecium sonneborni]|uniref:non-specific serine/threonine protein kinase n=1 Tax=Paramecium sonneborni TaxID=65129 RepID=A0A8S1QKY4_9CILI|nr:unnamed protein product [Paramecium sonneborni]